jgi:hypothetical protein
MKMSTTNLGDNDTLIFQICFSWQVRENCQDSALTEAQEAAKNAKKGRAIIT